MVCHTRLRIVVCTDLGRAVTGRYHGLTLCSDTVEILLVLHIVETSTEFLQSPVEVLQLRTLLLTLNHDT